MKTMTTRTMMPRRRMSTVMTVKHGMMSRRVPNHNVHIITPHGKVMSGRKGRV